MKYLINVLRKENSQLLLEVLIAGLPNHKLTSYPDEPFGMKPWPKNLYAMKTNDPKLERLIEENLEDSDAFVEKYGLPEGWDEIQVLDILALLGEFLPLTPLKTGNIARNLARALMQIVEAYSDAELYIGDASFPQKLFQFERIANWLIKLHLVNPNATKLVKNTAHEGMFHETSVRSLMEDYGYNE